MKHRPEPRTGGRVVTFDCGLVIPAAGMKRLREDDCVFMFSSDIKTVSARVFGCRMTLKLPQELRYRESGFIYGH